MTLLKRQDGYLSRQVILFRLQYEIHSLQMHSKLLCRSAVALLPNLLEGQYALRLVVVPCQYLPSLSPSFQPILPSPLSHISSVSVPHLLRRCIHPCCPASPTLCSSATVFTADHVCHPYYPTSPLHLHCCPPASLLQSLSNYLPSFRVLCRLFVCLLRLDILLDLHRSILHCFLRSAPH